MPRSAKEQVEITALLQGILNGYPGNTAIFREYLQNSDDAKATKQIFILDERQHPVESLCDSSLGDSQGPAFVAFNDGVLSDRDWEALRKIHSSSKKADETQTGKNGLGFRASYHLTENPHVLSGETLLIFDPHHRFDEHPGGMSIDILNEGADYPDQLKPFSDFVTNELSFVSGTAFRLPLRTEKQAKQSKIKNTPTFVEQIRSLLRHFCKAELEEVILFLKHISLIEVRHVDINGHCRVLGSVGIEDVVPAPSTRRGVHFRKIILRGEDTSTTTSRVWCYKSLSINKDKAARVVSERLGYDIGEALIVDKLFPSIDLATPVDGRTIAGALFTLLPLPIKTSFPVHLNAVFALTPDRQSLKNIEEVGTVESRERRFVEWNKAIFEEWTPTIWADLLDDLSPTHAPWSLWPPEEKHAYWNNLTLQLVKEILLRNSAIFPAASNLESFLSLDDSSVLISPPSFSLDLINLLVNLGVKVVRPPAHIFAILASDDVSIAARILSPDTLHGVLETGYQHNQWQPYDLKSVSKIIEYLVFSTSPPTLGNVIGLPWFVQPDGLPVTFQRAGVGQTCIIPSSEEEAYLFSSQLQMLSWRYSSDKLFSMLRDTKTSSILNVTLLQPSHILDVLSGRFRQVEVLGYSPDSDVAWIRAFWTWLAGWGPVKSFGHATDPVSLWSQLCGLYLLPTTSGRLRRLSERVVYFTADPSAATAWAKLGIPFLHRGVSSRAIIMLSKGGFIETPEKSSFIPFILDNVDPFLQNSLSADELEAIRRSLYSAAIRQRSPSLSVFSINSQQMKVLEELPIFYVRNPGGGPPTLNSVGGIRIHVNVSDDFPLPVQNPPVIYVDLGDPDTRMLVQMLGPVQGTDVLTLLSMAVDNWDVQPSALQDRIIGLILDNWRKLPLPTQKALEGLPFVTVNGLLSRVPPKYLIHPNAPITPLFDGEVGRFPIGRFAAHPIITTMQSLGFLSTHLDHDIVQERLQYICQNPSQDQNLFAKARTFVRLLDQHWEDDFGAHVRSHRGHPWIPLEMSSNLLSPNASRDHYQGSFHSDPDFYDLVLNLLPKNIVRVSNRDFRSALGWSGRVSTDILVRQLSKTILLAESEDRYKRLCKLIGYMSRLHGNDYLSLEDLSSIRSELTNCSWIPTSTSPIETVKSGYALLSGEYLKPPFRPINPVGSRSFFLAMGCTERPSLDILTFELRKYESDAVPTSDIPSVLALLQEIAVNHPGFDRASVLIPDQSRRSHPIDDTYYPDTDYLLPTTLQDKYSAHSSVSRALSDQLGIRLLSSLVLDLVEDAFGDVEQMGEDLLDRIRGFLREYDVSYALNEFLANADDARAKEFSILLDTRPHFRVANGLISPAFYELQRHDSIILFNDGVFSAEDFRGLRRVGRGGKVDDMGTHGRHGLGALSFYYFTDVVTVISGAYVMFLDPSGRYLPPSRGQRRTSLITKLSDVIGQYPNQLRQYESLFGLSVETTFYCGTLVCLPLNTGISAKHCDSGTACRLMETSYRELAQNAFFFTGLERVTGRIRMHRNEERLIWSFGAQRLSTQVPSPGLSYQLLEITSGELEETWMISTSAGAPIPEQHKTTATGLKVTSANLIVQLAIRLKPDLNGAPKSWLFSNLRLPRTTSLPFHLSARFAISSNRQNIVFDSPDSRKERDPKSEFNGWILAEVVPPLYLAALTFIIRHEVPQHVLPDQRWWMINSTDDISHHVSQAFLSLLAQSNEELFKTISEELLPFSDSVFANTTGPIICALRSLNAPRLVTGYESSLGTLKTAQTVNEAYIRSVFANVSLDTIGLLLDDGTIKLDDLMVVLREIRKEPGLTGLPLLVLSTNMPVLIPDKISGKRIYVSDNPAHANLFKSARFLHHKYCLDETLNEIWSSSESPVNVGRLTSNDLQQLIQDELSRHAFEEGNWLGEFWALYDTLPGKPSPNLLEDVRLVQGRFRHYSLQECRSDLVVLAHAHLEVIRLPLQHLALDMVDVKREEFRTYLESKFPEAVINVLQCLSARHITRFSSLSPEQSKILITWLTNSIESNISKWQRIYEPRINRLHLSKLEIWKAYTTRGEEVFRSAAAMNMLPSHFSIAALTPYIRRGCAVAAHSYDVTGALRFLLIPSSYATMTMNPSEILAAVTIPPTINNDDGLRTFADFLRNLFSFHSSELASISGTLRIFDVTGMAQPVHALYDHTIPLFSTSLKYTSLLLHPLLRDVDLEILRKLGLQYEISVPTFRTCVREIQIAHRRHLQSGFSSRADLFEMAHMAFACYQIILPRKIMRDLSDWSSLDRVEFVRPMNIRRQHASYPVHEYCTNDPRVLLPPSRFVLRRFEPIMWTQRFLFHVEPTEDVTAVNKKLGVPVVDEVVEHLKVLTTKVAVNHPGNSSLLSDIQATYKWLDEHAADAKKHMLRLGRERLFLNVDDPTNDNWIGRWSTAEELVLNVYHDYGDMKHVRKFLREFENLLQASGCSTLQSRGPTVMTTNAHCFTKLDLIRTFDDMRKSGKTTNMVLFPAGDNPEELLDLSTGIGQQGNARTSVVSISSQSELSGSEGSDDGITTAAPSDLPDEVFADLLELRAHSLVLAAAIPHVRTWVEDWKHDTSHGMDLLYFDGTYFGAKAVLDLIYTGDFDYTVPSMDDLDGLRHLLYEFLALLRVADLWDVPELKARVELEIHTHNLVERLLPWYRIMLRVAERYNADNLKNALAQMAEKNGELLRRFSLG